MADPKQPARSNLKLRIKLGGSTIHHAGPGGSTRKRLQEVGYPAPDAQLDAVAAALRLCSQESLPSFPTWEELVAEAGITSAHATCSGGSQHHGGHGASMAGVAGNPPPRGARNSCGQTAAVDSAPNDWQLEQAQSASTRQTVASQKRPVSPTGAQEVCKRQRMCEQEPKPFTIKQASAVQHSSGQPQLPASSKAEGKGKSSAEGGCCVVKVDESVLAGGGVLSSSSDQATTFGLYASLSTSPPEVSAQQVLVPVKQQDAIAAVQQVQPPGIAAVHQQQHQQQQQQPTVLLPPDRQQRPAQRQPQQSEQRVQEQQVVQVSCSSVPQQQAEVHAAPSKSQSRKRSMAVQTQEAVPLLPPTLFQGLPPVAPSQSATPLSQLTLPPQKCYLRMPPELASMSPTDEQFQRYYSQAKDKKRAADVMRQGSRAPWTPETLGLYVEAALLFMSAAECMMRMPHSLPRMSKIANLCHQTADFLGCTLKFIEGADASHLVRDCLRTLCERLAALCLLRENVASAHEFKECADRLDRLLTEVHKTGSGQLNRLSTNMSSDAGPSRRGAGSNGPAPDAPSSHDIHSVQGRGACSVSAQAEIGRLQGRLVDGARLTAKWSDLVRKSTLSFQSLTEKEETRSSEAASLACAHISAVSIAGGFVDGTRAIAHAYQALACVKAL